VFALENQNVYNGGKKKKRSLFFRREHAAHPREELSMTGRIAPTGKEKKEGEPRPVAVFVRGSMRLRNYGDGKRRARGMDETG